MSRELKIGVLCNSPSRQLAGQYERLAAELGGYRFVLLYRRSDQGNAAWTPAYPNGCDNEHLPATRIRYPGVLGWMIDGDIRPVLERHRFDAMIIHGLYDSSAQWQAYAWCRRHQIPYFVRSDANVTGETTLFRRLTRGWIVSDRVRGACGLLCIGTQNRRYYEYYGARAEQCFLAPWEIDYTPLEQAFAKASAARDAVRDRMGCRSDGCVFVSIGRLVKAKGYDTMIQAMSRLKHKGRNAELLIAGEGPLRTELEAQIAGENAPVRLLGNLDRAGVVEAMTAADAFVLASGYEPWGLVVNEAALCGLPLVVSDAVGAGADLLVEGENGYVYPAGDVDALAERLGRLAGDGELRQAMGAKSRSQLAWWRTDCSAVVGYQKALSKAFPESI